MHGKQWKRYLELMEQRPESFRNNGPLRIVTDRSIVEQFEKDTGKTIGVCYESKYNIMVVDLVFRQEGKYFAYERILPATIGRGTICVPEHSGKYVLLKQYRHALRDYQYAFPRGFATKGVSGTENALKELQEELGAHVKHIDFLGSVAADSGLSGGVADIYLCRIESYEIKKGYEGIVDAIEISLEELSQMIRQNKISDGFSLAACSYLTSGK